MLHPCFRIPRQSGWGWDQRRRLQYRRIDRYLTPLAVPMKRYGPGSRGATRSHHRPLEAYVDGLVRQGLRIDALREIPTFERSGAGARAGAENRAAEEIPLFLAVRAVRRG